MSAEPLGFEPIWQAIKGWDIQREHGAGYHGPTGDDVRAILSALAAAGHVIEQDWQPIKTAPKDGRWVHSYLARLLQNTHPQCEPLPDLRGLCTQIDNMVTEIPKLRAEVERLKGGIADAMRAVLAAIIPAIQAEALELAAAKCETHDWGKDVSWWLSATKKDVAAEAGRQCAAAIRALKEGT